VQPQEPEARSSNTRISRSNFELVLAQHGIEWPTDLRYLGFRLCVPVEPLDVVRRPLSRPAPGPGVGSDVFAAPSASRSSFIRAGSERSPRRGPLVVLPSTRSSGQGSKLRRSCKGKRRRYAPSSAASWGHPPKITRSGPDPTARSRWPIKLAKLPTGWHVFHSLPAGSHASDIDHVVVGGGGVFIMNTKHHPGATIWVDGDTFMVNGTKHPLRARCPATRLCDRLGAH